MTKYRKKPVEVDAICYTVDNLKEAIEFVGRHPKFDEWFPTWESYQRHVDADMGRFKIVTLEGDMYASPGDWIIRGIAGEFYPCRNDIFVATYEKVG